MNPDINILHAVHGCLDAVDPTLLTKLIIYRDASLYLAGDKLENAIECIYDAYIGNCTWIDLGIFTKNVAQQYDQFDSCRECVEAMIANQGDLE